MSKWKDFRSRAAAEHVGMMQSTLGTISGFLGLGLSLILLAQGRNLDELDVIVVPPRPRSVTEWSQESRIGNQPYHPGVRPVGACAIT